MPTTIHYVYHLDAGRDAVQSGRPASILRGLEAAGAKVQRIFPLNHRFGARRLVEKLFWHSMGRHYRMDRHPALLVDFARQAERRLARASDGVVFCPSTLPISWLETDLPVTFCADAPLAAMLNYYDSFSRLAPSQLRFAEEAEAAALHRANLAIYPSAWAAQSAIRSYGIDPSKVAVIPFGANFGKKNRRESVEEWINERPMDELRLLFVGKEWQRKGGSLVIETARLLIGQGLRVHVDIVGAAPPAREIDSFVTCHPVLSYSDPAQKAQLEALFRRVHLFFMPSRAEAYGLVYCEANAFGLPCIATTTGGAAEIVREGVNGYALPLEADATAYAEVIRRAVDSEAHYRQLALSSYDEFSRRLNWSTFCQQFLQLVERRVLPQSKPIGAVGSPLTLS